MKRYLPYVLAPIIAAAIASPGAAQTARPRGNKSRPATYGTVDETSHVIGAWQFEPASTGHVMGGVSAQAERFFTAGNLGVAHPDLPNGALVTAIEIQGCDLSATGEVTARLMSTEVTEPTSTLESHGEVSTGIALADGCGYFAVDLPAPITVDNFFRSYLVQITASNADATNRFAAVRLYYKLQVSPAPATATFADVPVGSPFHRFVEALVDAGITGGCGGGNYCPNQAVTRGQMAVFLSAALGLHFPN